jgi:outer membrane protein OmpA-like peptidoglycan-associated protein
MKNERMRKMRGFGNRVSGSLRASLLVGVSAAALLAGCDMFDGNTPVSSRQVRAGAERSVAVSQSLPSAGTGRQYETGIAAVDETRGGPQIGSIVAGKGGQKGQQEELAKAALDTDRKARAETERQLADRKAADAAAANEKAASVSSSQPAAQTAAAAPVTTTPIPPPTETAAAAPAQAADAAPPTPPVVVAAATAPAPARPQDPNKAFEPPPGWVPPGQSAPVVTADATPAPAATPPAPAPVVTTTAVAPVTAANSVATSDRLLPPSAQTQTATSAPPPAQIQSAPIQSPAVETASAAPPPAPPVAVASAPARRVDPNKAFEPPPGWTPPASSAGPEPVSTVATATTLLPNTPPASTSVASTTSQVANNALPPVASAPPPSMPIQSPPPPYEPTAMTQVRSATPRAGTGETSMPSTVADRPGFARPAEVAAAAPPPPASVTTTATPMPAPVSSTPVSVVAPPSAPPANLQADIARAQSGAVPASAITSRPGGPLEVAVIQFGRASSGLGGRDGEILREIAQIQKKNGGTVRVVAHAAQDVSGSSAGQIERGNYDVSRRRAINIADRLMALGVPRSAIVAEAASDSEPKYATNTARGVAANRRAEIYLDL